MSDRSGTFVVSFKESQQSVPSTPADTELGRRDAYVARGDGTRRVAGGTGAVIRGGVP